MATPRVRSACAASPHDLAPHLPRTFEVSRGGDQKTSKSSPIPSQSSTRPGGIASSATGSSTSGTGRKSDQPGQSKATPNGASPPSFAPLPVRMALYAAASLTPPWREALYALLDANMTPLAKGTSMEHSREHKIEEMFHSDARYLVLTRLRETGVEAAGAGFGSGAGASGGGVLAGLSKSELPANNRGDTDTDGDGGDPEAEAEGEAEADSPSLHMPGAMPITPPPAKRPRTERATRSSARADPVSAAAPIGDPADLLGFASFRFDTEETQGPKDAEVVYCYELQLSPAARGLGLGAVLMQELEEAGARQGMQKSMLTCLASNTTALKFYERAGYTPDEIDPTRVSLEGIDDASEVSAAEEEDEEEMWTVVPVELAREYDYRILSKDLRRRVR